MANVKVTNSPMPSNMYNVKCPYTMNAQYIVVHNTANDAPAANEIAYMKSNYNQVSFHDAVDDTGVVHCIPYNRNAWHASDGGNGPGNRKGIGVEICYSKSGGSRFDKAEENAAKHIANLLNERKWDVSHVKRHYDFALDKKYCPHRTMDKGWTRFLNMIKKYMNASTGPQTASKTEQMYRVRKSWNDAKSQTGAYKSLENAKKNCKKGYSVFDEKGKTVYANKENNKTTTFKEYKVRVNIKNLNIREKPSVSAKSKGYIKPGVYAIIGETKADGYTWGKLKSGEGYVSLLYCEKL